MITSSASEVGVEPKEASYYSSKPLILRNSWRAAQRNARQDAAEASKTGGLPLVVGTGIVFLTEIPEPGVGDDGMLAGSDLKQHPLDRLHTKAQLDSAVAELCCDASALTDTADPQSASNIFRGKFNGEGVLRRRPRFGGWALLLQSGRHG